ncbi:Putative transmembrane protein [Caenispirillum salinarum AK4]|uniref:Probable inorganic carbon transporter subunit DabA n=1 Tax=Caenispirillum salinarum AK4 TaxID=1238182 RepID=K9HAS4_9PROT|nr:DUF2309 domain-containing protein [Caenispirillum salinarum]EKV27648.1 Putative transmembrane protein [Caenispirillum salinarum AK4]
MTFQTHALKFAEAAASVETKPTPEAVAEAVKAACDRVAPLWPLKHFVAVNPFLGLAEKPFAEAATTLRRTTGETMLMPRGWYGEQIAAGRITDADLETALDRASDAHGLPQTAAALREALTHAPIGARPVVPTVSALVGPEAAEMAREQVSRWCAAWFDEGQASWVLPWRDLPAFEAWKHAAAADRTPDALGWTGLRAALTDLPDDPQAAVATALEVLEVPADAVADVLHRALADVAGWAAYARYHAWQAGLQGRELTLPVHILAIRLAWEQALYRTHADDALRSAWREALACATDPAAEAADTDTRLDALAQEAFDIAARRELVAALSGPSSPEPSARPDVHAIFCIDVRSEVYRRALEDVMPGARTSGFAGFFGVALELEPLGGGEAGARCPVLLAPKVTVRETVDGADATAVADSRTLKRRLAKAWKAFKMQAVSSFVFVETMGLGYIGRLAGDSLKLSRPVPDPATAGLSSHHAACRTPTLEPHGHTGMTPDQRVDAAETVLRAMSLTDGFARLLVLAGHGSTTVNNPHATGLDCGACGGHAGDANARVAAMLLNDPHVRAGLTARGIVIPDDTWVMAALHDTTTDDVRLFDTAGVPHSHKTDVAALEARLAEASAKARRMRADKLGLAGASDAALDAKVRERAKDWAQVRPEWGLAGNRGFIAAPRSVTRGIDLDGRVFLHDYDWRKDLGFGVLELILTAPMVVASWISLQYYGSTVNNRAFGSGDKVLHNVVGTLGVLEGNGGDLRTGLPWQSVHDGEKLVHEPIRLTVVVAAPEAEMDKVLEKHAAVRALVDNGWLTLCALHDDGTIRRRAAAGRWVAEAR